MNASGVLFNRYLQIAAFAITLHGVAWANQAVESRSERSPEQLTQMGFQMLQAQRFEEAERLFGQALAADPEILQARFGLGTLYFEKGQVARSIELLEQVRADAPEFSPVLNNLAWIYASTDELQYRDGTRAIRLVQTAIFRQPDSFQIWNTLAEAYYILGDYSRAKRAAGQAVRHARQQGAPQNQVVRYQQNAERARRAAHAESIFNTGSKHIEQISVLSAAP